MTRVRGSASRSRRALCRIGMMMRLRLASIAAALAAAIAVPAVGAAGEAMAPDEFSAVRYGSAPLEKVIESVERRYRANVVRVGQEEIGGRRVYVLRLLSEQGRVWTVRVDAETGREF